MTTPIETSRLLLRPLQLSDAQEIFEIRKLDGIHENFLSPQWLHPSEATTWINEIFEYNGLIYTISLLQTPSPSLTSNPKAPSPEDPNPAIIGLLGLSRWNTLTYFLHPTYWNKGYTTEAIKAFLPEIWKREPDRRHVSAAIMEGNEASRRVLEKCGFRIWDWGREEGFVLVKARSKPVEGAEAGSVEVGEDGGLDEEEKKKEAEGNEEEEEEPDARMLGSFGQRRLSKIQTDELTSAILSLNVQTKPLLEPIRAPPVEIEPGTSTSRPMKRNRLISFRYEPRFTEGDKWE